MTLFVLPHLIPESMRVQSPSHQEKKVPGEESSTPSLDFAVLLEESTKKAGWELAGGAYPSGTRGCCGNMAVTPQTACWGETTSIEGNGASRSFATSLPWGCSSSGCVSSCQEEGFGIDLTRVKESIAQFLEDVESIQFSLDLGEKGTLSITGGKNENGEFAFQIQGSKDALTEFFTMLFASLTALGQSAQAEQSSLNRVFPSSLNGNQCGCGGKTSGLSPCPSTPVDGEENESESAPSLEIAGGTTFSAVFETEGDATSMEAPGVTPETEDGRENGEEIIVSTQELASDARQVSLGEEKRIRSENPTPKSYSEARDTIPLGEAVPQGVKEVPAGVLSFTPSRDPEEVAQVFEQILQVASAERGGKEVTIKLEPESLGTIVVHVREDDQRVQCMWEVANPKAQELIQKSLPLLEARLAGQGLVFENFWTGENGGQPRFQGAFSYAGSPLSGESDEESPSRASFEEYRVNLLA